MSVARFTTALPRAVSRQSQQVLPRRRCLHSTAQARAITHLEMPAMSPTMTEGGIAEWKKKDGEAFVAGDVLLEIETDKATIDVEAQDDGVMGKIILQNGAKAIPVGKVIALLAEEGDDISNLEIPEDKPKPAATEPEQRAEVDVQPPKTRTPQQESSSKSSSAHSDHGEPSHSRPLFPSVHRLLISHDVPNTDVSQIKGTGVRGMLTKGDVLAFLGKASSPLGTFKFGPSPVEVENAKRVGTGKGEQKKVEAQTPMDGPAVRRLIVSTMLRTSLQARNVSSAPAPTFDSIIQDYIPASSFTTGAKTPMIPPPSATAGQSTKAYFDGLF